MCVYVFVCVRGTFYQGVVLSEADWTMLVRRVDPDARGTVVQVDVLDALGIEHAVPGDDSRAGVGPPPAPGSWEVCCEHVFVLLLCGHVVLVGE